VDYVPWGEGPEAWLIDDFLPLGMGEAGDSPAVSVQVLLLSGLEEDLPWPRAGPWFESM